ncbi:MAG TPA: hypothetical protein VJ810_31850 [Blastocatellia bacterium]|nr:hypothetical protein [Blastocatellia bacterium]
MNTSGVWDKLVWRNRLLAYSGMCYVLLFAALAVIAYFDSTQILGVNRWFKPMKFAVSIAIFQWTMGWLMSHLQGRADTVNRISLGFVFTMLAEIIPIVGQAARGELSHFNQSSTFGVAVFAIMGLAIVINTLLAIYVLKLFFSTPTQLPESYLWGIRLGLILFILGSAEGGVMALMMRHTVGAADGGAGLFFSNWSKQAGDLRVAHALALHALQALPFVGYMFRRIGKQYGSIPAVVMTFAYAAVYLTWVTILFVDAIKGRPLIKFK